MRTLSARSRIVTLGSCLAVWTILAACSVEEENPAAPARNRGPTATADGGGTTGDDAAVPTGAPLCGKYGGFDGVKTIASAIVTTAKGDCRISPEISSAEAERGANFIDCFQQFVGSGFQCPGVSFSLGQTTDSKNKVCNSQMPGVQFTTLDFNTFIKDVTTSLTASGLTEDEMRAIAPVFEAARLKLVNNPSKTKHALCAPNCAEGGDACIQPVLDAGNDVDVPPPDAGMDASDDAGDGG